MNDLALAIMSNFDCREKQLDIARQQRNGNKSERETAMAWLLLVDKYEDTFVQFGEAACGAAEMLQAATDLSDYYAERIIELDG